jgi:phosphoglycerol transferase MdoB-like AlkP superfamily enzyme
MNVDSIVVYKKKYIKYILVIAFMLFGLVLVSCAMVLSDAFSPVLRWVATLSVLAYLSILFISAFRIRKKYKLQLKVNVVRFISILATGLYIITDVATGAYFIKSSVVLFLGGYGFHFLILYIGTILFRRPKVWIIICISVLSLFSILEYYVTRFRGYMFTLSDVYNIKSAMAVKNSYKFTLDPYVVLVIIASAFLIFCTVTFDFNVITLKRRLMHAGVFVAVLTMVCTSLILLYNSGTMRDRIQFGRMVSPKQSATMDVGTLVMLYYDAIYNQLEAPVDYSTGEAEQILDSYSAEPYDDNVTVIAILNESWSDFSHIGDVDTNIDYLQNWHNMKENVVKGYVTVAPYGGLTCNSEFEFLTGNSMYFFPQVGVFTNYLGSKTDSIVSYMNDLNFDTVSITPCKESIWNIGKAYPYLGFKKSYYESDMVITADDISEDKYMYDSALYKKAEDIIDARDKSKSSFYYIATMQNHSPYENDRDNGLKLNSPYDECAENYLNSIVATDNAFADLVDHYKDADEHVVIVMFGDHYPHVENIYEKLYGDSDLSTGDYAKLHQTPFIIWSNKTIQSKWIDDISLNYLSNEVFDVAGIPLSPVQQELERVRSYIPIISGFGYKTKDDEWFEKGGSCKYDDILHEYHVLQWYRVFDNDRRILKSH